MTAARDLRISGAPSAQEVAAVVAALHAVGSDGRSVGGTDAEALDGYERWRRQRLAALGPGRAAAGRTRS